MRQRSCQGTVSLTKLSMFQRFVAKPISSAMATGVGPQAKGQECFFEKISSSGKVNFLIFFAAACFLPLGVWLHVCFGECASILP